MPDRDITTVKALCEQSQTPFYEICFDETHSPIYRKMIRSVESWDVRSPYVYCGLVEDVRFFGRSFIFSKTGKFVFHCQSYLNHQSSNFEECAQLYIDGKTDLFKNYMEEECIFLGGTWSEATPQGPSHLTDPPNFGHFIFEYLNRLAIFAHYGLLYRLPIVVYDIIPARWLEFLELAGVSKNQIIRISLDNPPAFRKAWVSSACHYRDTAGVYRVWGAGVHALRSLILTGIGGASVSKRRRIYLGRDNAQWRKIANEHEVKALLDTYGFEYPVMSQLSAREQVEVISSAEIVVCALGAGTVMTQFAPEHCITILLAPAGVGGIWGGLASAIFLRQIYDRLDCERVSITDNVRINAGGVNELADLIVDIAALNAKIKEALHTMSVGQTRDALKL